MLGYGTTPNMATQLAPSELYFALQRDVKFKDFATLVDILNSHGHTTTPLNRSEGGICFRTDGEDVGRDLRFCPKGGRMCIPETDGVFTADPSDIFATFTAPEWSEDNSLFVKLYNRGKSKDFTAEETVAIRNDIATALGVVENTIRTEGRGIEDSDTPEMKRRFLNFNRAEAIAYWTIPDPSWPKIEQERLFKCWKCHCRRPYFHFEHSGFDGLTAFERLLGRYELRGSLSCCKDCSQESNIFKWTERASKRLRTLE
jgi:hypothetical protein